METRLLILNSDPVFEDRALAMFDAMRKVETCIVRTLSEAIYILMRENFDLFVVEGEPAVAIGRATNTRQHFPSLDRHVLDTGNARRYRCWKKPSSRISSWSGLTAAIDSCAAVCGALCRLLERKSGTPAEGIDPCHSLVGNLNQFSAAEILQMSCMSQQSGRFTFKSSRGNSEIYLHHGMVRHAIYSSLEGEDAVAEIFRWRQGRFYFEEGIISQVQTVNRPWTHLLIDNLQKLDETLHLTSVAGIG